MITKTNSLMVSETVFNILLSDEEFVSKVDGCLDTFNNCRETGFMMYLYNITENIWVFKNRNSDDIVVVIGELDGLNNMFSSEAYKQRKYFPYMDFFGAVSYIKETILKEQG